MARFIVRRVLYSFVTLFILSATIFLIVRLTGDPVALMAEASARPEDLERIRHQWGLDRSWPVQYVTFMENALTGELRSEARRVGKECATLWRTRCLQE